MYGTQANRIFIPPTLPFENDVNMYGTQALSYMIATHTRFENDVNMYGTQAESVAVHQFLCLRMM